MMKIIWIMILSVTLAFIISLIIWCQKAKENAEVVKEEAVETMEDVKEKVVETTGEIKEEAGEKLEEVKETAQETTGHK